MRISTLPKWRLMTACLMSVASQMTYAASKLTSGGTTWIASENNGGSLHFKVSVYAGMAGYAGTYDADGTAPGELSSDPFNNTVRAYRFWNMTKEKTIGTLTQSGGIIGDLRGTPNKMLTANWMQLWESTDPKGIDFSSPADHSQNTVAHGLDDASGSINISGMTNGSIYFIYGAYRSLPTLNVRMSGSGSAKDIELGNIHNGDRANNNEVYIARVDFENNTGHQSVDWEMPKGAIYRFCGIVVTSSDPLRSP